ncbi:MAG: hypothetical protein PHI59_02340, partial [Candidatus Omnitrophica bacterium]|nr:hypothetical protein [Candidatus Omnitrophota bacterium]
MLPLIIADFDDNNEITRWTFVNSKAEQSAEHAVSGNKSFKVNFHPSKEASAVKIEEYFKKDKTVTDWSNYETLHFNIFNPDNGSSRLILQVKDNKGKKTKIDLSLRPQADNKFDVELSRIGAEINLANISQLNFFTWDNKQERTYYFDNIMLLPEGNPKEPKKSIFDTAFLPAQNEKVYATGDYFEFPKATWLKENSEGNTNFIEIPLILKSSESLVSCEIPFSGGVPFPRGELLSLDNLVLVDSAGKFVPFQSKVLSRWPDKSIKW